MPDSIQLSRICSQVRRDIVRMVHGPASGHPGGSLGCTEYFVALYFDLMRLKDGFDMDGRDEDVFYLSNGHISPVWYSVLAHRGYFKPSELASFRLLNSRLQGHPTPHEHLPGIRAASGSLGQGMSMAIGTAWTKKLNRDPHLVYSLHGDGELQEGQIWEAMLFAAHNKVDNYIATIDYNGQQIDGSTEQVLSLGDLDAKARAFGWTVLHIHQGNDIAAVVKGIREAIALTGQGKPVFVIMHTVMGAGVDFMAGSHKWHGVAPNDAQLALALAQLEETLGDY
jgi:transketolase